MSSSDFNGFFRTVFRNWRFAWQRSHRIAQHEGTFCAEQAEVFALYEEALELWSYNPYQDSAFYEKQTLEDMGNLVKLLQYEDFSLTIELATILMKTYQRFMKSEPTLFEPPVRPDNFAKLSLKKQVKVRRVLERYIKHQKDAEVYIIKWIESTIAVFYDFLHQLDIPASSEHPASIHLQMKLLDFAHNPAELVDRCFGVVEGETAQENEFDVITRWRMVNNFNVALGIEHHMQTKQNAYDYVEQNPTAEAAETLLKGTPFETLLLSHIPLPVSDKVRFEHTHILAGIGHGKSQLLQQLILADLSRDPDQIPSMVIIDSQGDMIDKIKRLEIFSPAKLGRRLLVIDPSDVHYTPELNLFDFASFETPDTDAKTREQIFNGVIETFDFIFSGLVGADLTAQQSLVFRYLAELMRVIPNANIHTFRKVLEEPHNYIAYMEQTSPVTRDFLIKQFTDKRFNQTRHYILNRLYMVMQNPTFERMFGAARNRLDLFSVLNEGGIVLVNTSKDFLKQSVSSLFGRYIIANVFKAVLERASIPEQDRKPTFLYVDEASEYFDTSFESLIVQARKYKLGLHFAHQHLDQIPKSLKNAVLGSTSVKFAGGISDADTKVMAANMRTSTDFINGQRVKNKGSDFALYVKNVTTQATPYRVNFGAMESQPRMSKEDLRIIRNASRLKLTGRSSPASSAEEERKQVLAQDITDTPESEIPAPETIPQDVSDDVYNSYEDDGGWQPY